MARCPFKQMFRLQFNRLHLVSASYDQVYRILNYLFKIDSHIIAHKFSVLLELLIVFVAVLKTETIKT